MSSNQWSYLNIVIILWCTGRDDDLYSTSSIVVMDKLFINDMVRHRLKIIENLKDLKSKIGKNYAESDSIIFV
jgi:hypothetical protein